MSGSDLKTKCGVVNFIKTKYKNRNLEKNIADSSKVDKSPIDKPAKEQSLFSTIFFAIIIAFTFRSFFFEPFHIPSSSMNPGLLTGDYIFVSKYSFGYSRYSFPFGINFFSDRIFYKAPKRGDVLVFRLPSNPKINYIKRVIGLPGDEIQLKDSFLYINGNQIKRVKSGEFTAIENNISVSAEKFIETMPEGKKIEIMEQKLTPQDNTGVYTVPYGYYFAMGDNRDNSEDSRFLNEVGFIPEENLIGEAKIIFFSCNSPIWYFWKWYESVRIERIFKKIE